MNANCRDNKGRLKLCPYRVLTEEHKAIAIGNGDYVTQRFYECAEENCIAYHDGICLRAHEVLKEVK